MRAALSVDVHVLWFSLLFVMACSLSVSLSLYFSVWTFHLSSLYLSTHCKRWVPPPQLDRNLTRNSLLKPPKSIALVIFAIDGIVEGNSLIAAFHLSAASLVNTNSKISSSFKASRSFDYVDKKFELADYNCILKSNAHQQRQQPIISFGSRQWANC